MEELVADEINGVENFDEEVGKIFSKGLMVTDSSDSTDEDDDDDNGEIEEENLALDYEDAALNSYLG